MLEPKPHRRWDQRRLKTGELRGDAERLARAETNPATFGESVLGYRLYPKQREALEACAAMGCRVSIAAANGGGKTSRLIPSIVTWHASMYPQGKIKITSGSYTQIEDQIWPALIAVKKLFPAWKWLETPHFDTPEGGFCRCFTTNEPGRAEGDHGELPDAPLLFIVDEAKTSPPWLRGVIQGRVRPDRLILLSSHGFSEGWFYDSQTILRDQYECFQITADDCAHISEAEKQEVRATWAAVPEFAASILGFGFMPLVEDAVINGKALEQLMSNPPKFQAGEKHLFCDFAWSNAGAENVLAMRNGNRVTLEDCFHADSLHLLVEKFVCNFHRLGLSQGDAHMISGDNGGGGKLVIDEFENRGWFINRVDNGAAASDPEHYANLSAEIWWEGSKHITAGDLILPRDTMLRGQLTNRKRKANAKQKLAIESKEEMRERGVPSPDRADALLGSLMPCSGYISVACSNAKAVDTSGLAKTLDQAGPDSEYVDFEAMIPD